MANLDEILEYLDTAKAAVLDARAKLVQADLDITAATALLGGVEPGPPPGPGPGPNPQLPYIVEPGVQWSDRTEITTPGVLEWMALEVEVLEGARRGLHTLGGFQVDGPRDRAWFNISGNDRGDLENRIAHTPQAQRPLMKSTLSWTKHTFAWESGELRASYNGIWMPPLATPMPIVDRLLEWFLGALDVEGTAHVDNRNWAYRNLYRNYKLKDQPVVHLPVLWKS